MQAGHKFYIHCLSYKGQIYSRKTYVYDFNTETESSPYHVLEILPIVNQLTQLTAILSER